ncbi:hypothetical protein BDW68DRAFT_192064 [Aspergillus falconensis]
MHSISNNRFSFLLLYQPTFVSYIAHCRLPHDQQCVWPKRAQFTDDNMEVLARKLADYPICELVVFGELWRRRTKAQLISLEGDAIHKVTPNSALGGCTAMEDAAAITNQLHELLNRHPNKKLSTWRLWITPWIGLDTLAINIAKLCSAGTKLNFVEFAEQKGLLGWGDTIAEKARKERNAWNWQGNLQQIWPLLVGLCLCLSSTLVAVVAVI